MTAAARGEATETTTRQKLLDAAQRIVARDGVTGLSIRSVAAEAGVYMAAVHYHFGSKNELMDVLARQLYETAADEAAAAARAVPPGMPRVRYILEWWLDYWTKDTDLIFFDVLGYTIRHEDQLEGLRSFYDHWTDLLVELLDDFCEGTEIHGRPLAVLLRIFTDGRAIDRLVQLSSSDREMAVAALEALLESMAESKSR